VLKEAQEAQVHKEAQEALDLRVPLDHKEALEAQDLQVLLVLKEAQEAQDLQVPLDQRAQQQANFPNTAHQATGIQTFRILALHLIAFTATRIATQVTLSTDGGSTRVCVIPTEITIGVHRLLGDGRIMLIDYFREMLVPVVSLPG
jgi:hypothetical protein